jgi:hypothetical protein
MIVAFALSALLAAAEPPSAAPADPGQAAKPQAKPAKPDDKDRMICRREEVTGSHHPEKICHTKREWEQMTDEAQRMFRENGIQAVDRSTGQGAMPAPH